MRADVGEGKGTGEGCGKVAGAVTHWKVLGSSVRPLLPSPRTIQAYTYVRLRFWYMQKRAPVSLVSLDLETGAKHQLRVHLSKVLDGEETPSLPLIPQNCMRMLNAMCYNSACSWRPAVLK